MMSLRRGWSRIRNSSSVACALAVTLPVLGVEPVYVFTHVVGATRGDRDAVGDEARFFSPEDVAVAADGTVYVADTRNHAIRKITREGSVSTFAGRSGQSGAIDGKGAAARFFEPCGMAIDGGGNLYVADRRNAILRKITPSGEVSTLAGGARFAGSADGEAASARFRAPGGVAIDSAGNLYVADSGNHTIRKITTAGVVMTLAGSAGAKGSSDGAGAAARFDTPSGVAVDGVGNVYVADAGNFTLRKITPAGVVTTVSGLAGRRGTRDGTGQSAEFQSPRRLVMGAEGVLYLTDGHAIRKVTLAGAVTTWVGVLWSETGGFVDDVGTAAFFSTPSGMGVDRAGNLFVADTGNSAVRRIGADGRVTTLAGPSADAIQRGVDGPVAAATVGRPAGVAVDADGSLFVADFGHRDRKIRKINAGMVSSLAQAAQPSGIAVGGDGNVYVADWGAQVVRRISPNGAVSVLAGLEWVSGGTDGMGSEARFNGVQGVAVDPEGNVLVAESLAVRKITPGGRVTTLAGMQRTSGFVNGVLADARFQTLTGIAVGAEGTIYVTDWASQTVRKISLTAPADQAVTTFAGSPGIRGSADGVGTAARFQGPRGVAVDASGNVYVTDDNHLVRKITAEGRVTTIGGWAGSMGNDDGAGAAARFSSPNAIAVDADGTLYIADFANNAIRKGVPVVPVTVEREPESQAVAPWGWVTLSTTLSADPPVSLQWLRNGREVYGATSRTLTMGEIQPYNAGLYALRGENPAGARNSRAAIVGISMLLKVIGTGRELTPADVVHPNGNVFDQVLLTGVAEAITADHAQEQVTRTSFIDLDGDIVQVEFSGPGTLSLVLENASGPALADNYNQPDVKYMKGHAGIVIVGATEKTNVSVFTVGRATAFDPTGAYNLLLLPSETNDPAKNGSPLFAGHEGTNYDGIADIAFIAIASANGKFGGVRTSNANYFASTGHTGVYAPGVTFEGPVFIGDVTAFDEATPAIQLGAAGDVRITGGDLFQDNGATVEVSGFAQLKFTAGGDSHGRTIVAKANQAKLMRDGVDMTAQIAVNP